MVKGNIREERIYLGNYELYRKYVNNTLDTERQTLHIVDDTRRVAMIDRLTIDNGITLSTPVVSIRYQYDNHLGSASLELDQNAAIISYEEYHPFGTTSYRSGRTETEVALKRYKYVGKERDEERRSPHEHLKKSITCEQTGLYYYGARYYAAWIARFVSVDPAAEERQWLSPYNYCSLNPINRIDPDGMLDDWIYNIETEEYVWDGNVTKPSETPAGYEYVGASLKDVDNHFGDNNPIASILTNPKFGENKTPWPGEILPADNLTSLELWLESPAENFGEGIEKTVANIGYSIVNSPYSLLTGQTIGSTLLNSSEKMNAFIDVVPALIFWGLTKTGQVIKTTKKGLQGFNQFVKGTPGITAKEGLPAGMKWQQRAGQLFQTNKINQQGLKDFGKGLKTTGVISTTKKEIEK